MMVLSVADPGRPTATTSTNLDYTHTMKGAALRRRRNKGKHIIAGYGNSLEDDGERLSTSQQNIDTSSTPSKPCHSARLALLSAQNSVRMGARTQLNLCPPGANRRAMQSALRMRHSAHQQQLQNMTSTRRSSTVDPQAQFFALEKFVGGSEQLDYYEVQEEEYLLKTNTFEVDSDEEASSGDEDELLDIDLMFSEEPLNLDEESIYKQLSEGLYTPVAVAAAGSSKLPFNRRKLHYFDLIRAEEMIAARSYLQTELRQSKKRAAAMLVRHLRRIQAAERLRKNGESSSNAVDLPDEKDFMEDGVSPFPHDMTPAMAAAILLESLKLNPHESVEGMAACYDGIVAAGTALLDSPDPTQPNRSKASRSEIMAALAPLLITTLEQPSGEVILMLARLRRMCGTARYQRRFVQRVAPLLIRPPGAAMWCLRHQNDMEAVLAAAELIFDAAFEIFSKGWYERGRWMLADSKRAETLSAAAKQLRSLSQEPADGLTFLHPQRRTNRYKQPKDEAKAPLAEWEVIAVDRQIRISISSVLRTDWSKASSAEIIPKPIRLRGASTGRRHLDMSPRTPRSPRATSPRNTIRNSPSEDQIFGPSFSTERPVSPPPPSLRESRSNDSDTSSQQANNMPPPKSPKSPKRTTLELSPKRYSRDSPGANNIGVPANLTPLSPSASSVGTSGSTDVTSYKPLASASSVGTAPHYRSLTSTAAERKRTVAACRALRSQIQRFEEAFVQLHGRHPKGPADRAPLATTYAQYREWKRAIRADAACRIQAFVRGASCRWKLMRYNNPKITRVVMKKAGRGSGKESILNQISIPTDLGNSKAPTGVANKPDFNRPVALPWPNETGRPRTSSGGSAESFPSPGAQGSPILEKPSDLAGLSFKELQARKRDLKQQLKQYDMDFAQRHGRMPVKAEKEPIRHKYESYNLLKSQISRMEQEGRHLSAPGSSPVPAHPNQRAVTPPSGSESGDSATRSSPIFPSKSKRKLPKPNAPNPSGQDLAALKAEKSNLHTMLRAYEKEFYKENNRQVSSFADIKPVASQYRRYKEIKKAIAALQQGEGS